MKKNQSALITGASSGIGAAIAIKLAQEGFDLILMGRSLSRLQETQSKCIGVQSILLDFDLKNISENNLRIESALNQLPPLHILVNNAGVYHMASFAETTPEIWQEQFDVNLLSAVKLTQFIWPYFLKQKSGSVINISSTLGVKPTGNTSAYSAIKAAMINWTKSLAQEGAINNIRANCICPGIVDTPIHSFHEMPTAEKSVITKQMASYQLLNFIGESEDVAEATVFLATDKSRWTTGAVLNVDGGINIK